MDQPAQRAALGTEPVRTIDRDELKAKLDRGNPFKLIMALDRWAYVRRYSGGLLEWEDAGLPLEGEFAPSAP